MDVFELEVARGGNTFKAKGPPDIVKEHFAMWRDWMSSVPTPVSESEPKRDPEPVAVHSGELFSAPEGGGAPAPAPTHSNGHLQGLDRLYSMDGDIVNLTAAPQGDSARGSALLLVLLGFTRLAKTPEVSGFWLMKSLKNTGLPGIDRIDTIANPYIQSAHIVRSGFRGTLKYKLTVTGLTEAERLAKSLLENMPGVLA